MKQNNLIMMVVLVLVVGGGAFFGGMTYSQSKATATRRQFAGGMAGQAGQFGGNRAGGAGVRGGQVMGDIVSVSDTSMTVKLADGSSKIVILSETGSIVKSSPATKTDLVVGEKVAVFGATNSDGSVTAQNIQLNPIMRGPADATRSPAPTQGQ
ncbi:MAG: hypothetical protein WCV93_00315 [Candidatus Shapirobacteria bacterium]|jgi:hypothetical protein